MPSPQSFRPNRFTTLARIAMSKRAPRKPDEGERAPVEPTRPKPFLSGGAEAELEYDD